MRLIVVVMRLFLMVVMIVRLLMTVIVIAGMLLVRVSDDLFHILAFYVGQGNGREDL